MKQGTKWIIITISFIVFMILVAIGYNNIANKYANLFGNKKVQSQKEAVDFSVYDENEEKVNLSNFKGKPVVINFWATWCGYCTKEMPFFEDAYLKEKDIVFMMINATDGVQETKEKAKQYVKQNNFTFPVYYDKELEATNKYQVYSFPMTLFINKDGNIVTKHIGMITKEKLMEEINKIKEEYVNGIYK